jgi:UDP-N-acetylmuramate: L-alanyl-gamma-D-glutamyl-meso-diaminopimelate ligase
MGICGTGMASLAGILKEEGFQVKGSDQGVYPPMSEFLHNLSIPVFKGYKPGHLHPHPDLVIVGNVITKDNPEAVELARLKIPYLSLPQALKHFAFKGKRSIVVSGTHGKTTTSSLIAWILENSGVNPGFMIGGIPSNFGQNFKLGQGPYFVLEGDEYDTAFFDKGPKFLHYDPWIVILTSIEFDHADIYRDLEHVISSFRKLIRIIPPDGLIIANGEDPIISSEIAEAGCPVITYGLSGGEKWSLGNVKAVDNSTLVEILKGGEDYGTLSTSMYGSHNISNLLSAVVLGDYLEIPFNAISKAVEGFKGVKRRQEIIGETKGILVLDDFAHHPTAVRKTIEAVKEKYRDRRTVAVFEPRSNTSRRNVFQELYARSFDKADMVMIPEPPMMERVPEKERFSSKTLVKDLENNGRKAFYFPDTEALLKAIISEVREGDIILFMSNGGFDNLPCRLFESLTDSMDNNQ